MTSDIKQDNNRAKEIIETLMRHMGFFDFSISLNDDGRKVSVFINDAPFITRHLPGIIADMDFVLKMIFKKENLQFVFIDINNYRKEREDIIIKLAKASARKAIATKQEVPLPAMNAYERRIVHAELSLNPDITTESIGEGKQRHIVVKLLGL